MLFIVLSLAGLIILIWGFYALVGHALIKVLYEKKCFSFLNWFILQGKDAHPLKYYFDNADASLIQVLKGCFKCTLSFLFLSIISGLKNKVVYFYILFILFLASVALRLPDLGRPLSDHHEWVTAHTMIILKNWESQGALKHNFCLLTTYPEKANKFIPNLYGRAMSNSGDGYYMSFPPFAVIFPFVLFKLFFIPITPINLQVLNLMFHLISAYFVYAILCLVLKESVNKKFAALMGSIYFIFLPANLWFFSNIYSWDIFWHYLWIIGIFQFLTIIKDTAKRKVANISLLLLGLNVFFMIYTEYTGILFALSVIIYATLKLQKTEYFKKLMSCTIGAAVGAIVLLVVQYSSMNGFGELVRYFKASSAGYAFRGLSDVIQIATYYRIAYGMMFIAILAMLFMLLKKNGLKFFAHITQDELTLLYFCFFPVITHHLLQLNATAQHDFRVVKSSLLFISLTVLLFNNFYLSVKIGQIQKSLLLLLLAASILLPISTYKDHYAFVKKPAKFAALAREINKEARGEDVVFLITEIGNTPPIVFHAGRNMLSILKPEEAQAWMEQYCAKRGIIFYINDIFKIDKIEKVKVEI